MKYDNLENDNTIMIRQIYKMEIGYNILILKYDNSKTRIIEVSVIYKSYIFIWNLKLGQNYLLICFMISWKQTTKLLIKIWN